MLKVPRVLMVLVPRVLQVLTVLVLTVLVLTVLVLMVPAVQMVHAQQGTGVIAGRVVDGVSGKPIGAAIVTIAGAGMTVMSGAGAADRPRVLTGADGRFVFRDLPRPGSFAVSATKNGYAEGASGRRRPGGASTPVDLGEAPAGEVVVAIWKNGAITGTVTDESGEPLIGVQVRALVRTRGERTFAPFFVRALTDDRGVYRLSNLLAGDYLVDASPPPVSVSAAIVDDTFQRSVPRGTVPSPLIVMSPANALRLGDAFLALGNGSVTPPPPNGTRAQIYPPTFHPAALTVAQASIVSLGTGEERQAVDIQLTPVAASRVSGILVSPAGAAGPVSVSLVPQASGDVPSHLLSLPSMADSSGAFVFAAVAPGSYVLRARGNDGMAVEQPITVGGDDLDGVVATFAPPLKITAHLQFDGTSPPAPLFSRTMTSAPFLLESVDGTIGGAAAALVPGEREFTVSGYPPGRYRVRVTNSPRGWMFKTAMLNGVDVSEAPFEFTHDIGDLVLSFTDRWSGLDGLVQGRAPDTAAVLAFTTDAAVWTTAGSNSRRLRAARADARGHFAMGSLPPGDYYVIAVPEDDADGWRDPRTLELLAATASRVTIMEGEFKTLSVPMRQVPK